MSLTKTGLTLALIILITGLWLFVLEANHPRFFSQGDSITYFLPAYAHNWRSVVQQKTLPLVNFHQFLGQTHLAKGQPGVLYPPVYLAVGLSLALFKNVFYAMDIIAIMHWLAAVPAMFLLLRQLKLNRPISAIGALMWITFPYLSVTSRGWPLENHLLVYLPLNFLFLEKLLAKPQMKYALLLAAVKTWFIFGGYPEYTLRVLIFELMLIAAVQIKNIGCQQSRQAMKLSLLHLFSAGVFLLAATPLLLPMYEAKTQSAFRATPLSLPEFLLQALTFKDFGSAQLLTFRPNVLGYTINSSVYHVGFINLALISLLAIRKVRVNAKRHRAPTYVFLAITTCTLSTSLYGIFYVMPFLNSFRGPYKFFPFALFFSTIVIGGIAGAIIKKASRLGKQAIYGTLLLSVAINALLVWNHRETARSAKINELGKPLSPAVLPAIQPEQGRLLTFNKQASPDNAQQGLNYNFASLYNVNYFAGYEPLVTALNQKLSLDLNSQAAYDRLPDQEMLDYLSSWSVRYLLTGNIKSNQNLLNSYRQLKPRYQNDDIILYENTAALPYVYEKGQPKETVPHKFGINEVNIFPANKVAHRLIVNIAPLPHYVVYLDGQRIGQVASHNGPIHLDVPANAKNILIRYEDPLFRAGIGISLSVCLSVMLYCLIPKLITSKKMAPRLRPL